MAFSHYNNISAQLPLNLSGKLIDGTVAEQTAQCLAYVKAIVESVDHAVEDIVKVNVYLADIADLARHERGLRRLLRRPQARPARSWDAVSCLRRPRHDRRHRRQLGGHPAGG